MLNIQISLRPPATPVPPPFRPAKTEELAPGAPTFSFLALAWMVMEVSTARVSLLFVSLVPFQLS